MTIVLQNGLSTEYFDPLRSARDYSFTLFLCRWRNNSGSPIWTSVLTTSTEINKQKSREKKMKEFLKIAAAPATALFALALVTTATPAAAGEYCRNDYSGAGVRTCSFATMEQCQAAVSGRNGFCERDPFMPDNSSAYAYQPKHPISKSRNSTKTPVQ